MASMASVTTSVAMPTKVMVGRERDFNGLKARWVMWLDVPKEMRKHESVAYKPISDKRDTHLGINAGWRGSPAAWNEELLHVTGVTLRTASAEEQHKLGPSSQREAPGSDAPGTSGHAPAAMTSPSRTPGATTPATTPGPRPSTATGASAPSARTATRARAGLVPGHA